MMKKCLVTTHQRKSWEKPFPRILLSTRLQDIKDCKVDLLLGEKKKKGRVLTPIAANTMAKLSSWSSSTLFPGNLTRPPCLQIWAAIYLQAIKMQTSDMISYINRNKCLYISTWTWTHSTFQFQYKKKNQSWFTLKWVYGDAKCVNTSVFPKATMTGS